MIYVRVTEKEWNQIHEKMRDAGMRNMSAYIRKMAFNGFLVKLDLSDVREVLRLLHINSNNLNQFAKRAKALDAAVKNVILFSGRTTDFLIHYQRKSLSQ